MTELPKPIGYVGVITALHGTTKVFASSEDMLGHMGEAKKFQPVFTAEQVTELMEAADEYVRDRFMGDGGTPGPIEDFRAAYCKVPA